MSRTLKWEDLRPEEFYQEFDRAPIAYWSCGSMEEHGLHNPLGVDPSLAYEICLRASRRSGGIVFPSVPLAPAYNPGLSRKQLRDKTMPLFPPSLWFSRELCEQVYIELLESLADIGFRACVAVGGHNPAERMLEELTMRLDGHVNGMKFWGGGITSPQLLRDDWWRIAQSTGSHGCMLETSMQLAVNPATVDLSRAEYIQQSPLPSQLKVPMTQPEHIPTIKQANPKLGDQMLNIAAERLAKIAEQLVGRAPTGIRRDAT